MTIEEKKAFYDRYRGDLESYVIERMMKNYIFGIDTCEERMIDKGVKVIFCWDKDGKIEDIEFVRVN